MNFEQQQQQQFQQPANPQFQPSAMMNPEVNANAQFLPDSISYAETPDVAFAHKYNQIIITPVGNASAGYMSGEKATFMMKSQDFVDPHEIYIQMTIQSWPLQYGYLGDDLDNPTYHPRIHFSPAIKNKVVQMDGGPYSLFEQITIMDQNNKIEEITKCDVLGSFLNHTNNTQFDKFCKSFEGLGGLYGNALNAGSSMTFPHNLSKTNPASQMQFERQLRNGAAGNYNTTTAVGGLAATAQSPWGFILNHQDSLRWVDGNIAFAPIKQWPNYPKLEYYDTGAGQHFQKNSTLWSAGGTAWSKTLDQYIVPLGSLDDLTTIDPNTILTDDQKMTLFYSQLGVNVPQHLSILKAVSEGKQIPVITTVDELVEPSYGLQMSQNRTHYPMIDEESILLQRGDANKNKMSFWHPCRDPSFTVEKSSLYYHKSIHGFEGFNNNTPGTASPKLGGTTSTRQNQIGLNGNINTDEMFSGQIGFLDPSLIFQDWSFAGPLQTNFVSKNLANISSWGAPQVLRTNNQKTTQYKSSDSIGDPAKNFANRSPLTPDDKNFVNTMTYAVGSRGEKVRTGVHTAVTIAGTAVAGVQRMQGPITSAEIYTQFESDAAVNYASTIGFQKKINEDLSAASSTTYDTRIDPRAAVNGGLVGNDNDTMFYGLENPFPVALTSSCFEPTLSATVNQRYMKDGFPCIGPVTEHTVFLPFMSGLGALMPAEDFKLIPWRAFKNCEIIFDFADSALFTSWHTTDKNARKFIVKDFKMIFSVAKFYDDTIYRALDEQLAAGVILKTVSWYCCAYQILPGGVIPAEIQINVGFDSLKALLWCFYSRDYTQSTACRKHQAFSPCISEFQIQNGSDLYPLDPISGNSGTSLGGTNNFNFLYQLKKVFGKHSAMDLGHVNSSTFAINNRQFNYLDAQDQLNQFPIKSNSSTTITDLTGTSKYFKWQKWNYDHPAFGLSLYNENSQKALALFGYDLDRSNYEAGVISGINTTQNRPFKLRLKQARAVTLPFGRDGEVYVFGKYDLQLQLTAVNVIPKGLSG